MPTTDLVTEFRSRWLPHLTDAGVGRLAELLAKASPLLVHGTFTRAVPMGCLASHAGWNHPATRHCGDDAGIRWLSRVAGLNPATSVVIQGWDENGVHDHELRGRLLAELRAEQDRRAGRC